MTIDTRAVDTARIESAVLDILIALGEDPARPGLAETPQRVAASYAELFGGLAVDPVATLGEPVPTEVQGDLVAMRDIAFRSMCEHHLLPFSGVAHVAYAPSDAVVGLGRIPELVDVLASRPQVQERLGDEIADALEKAVAPLGVLVVLEARHECVAARGPRQGEARTLTIASRGTLAPDAAGSGSARSDALALLRTPEESAA